MKRKLNVKLLRRIQAHITEEPRRFFMEGAAERAHSREEWKRLASDYSDMAKTMPPCGAAACIAGWTNILTKADFSDYANFPRAIQKLGVKEDENFYTNTGADFLFLADEWPEPFMSRYEKAKTPKTRAKIACERIDHLILTGE